MGKGFGKHAWMVKCLYFSSVVLSVPDFSPDSRHPFSASALLRFPVTLTTEQAFDHSALVSPEWREFSLLGAEKEGRNMYVIPP